MVMKEKKVLLVEDDQDHADLIIDILEEESQKEVILKKDGQEAINYFQKRGLEDDDILSEIDVVILDLNLPKVHGMDVLKFLKNDPRYYYMPVIIFSTSSDYKTVAEAYRNGANGYLTKPISYDEFIEKIKLLKEYWLKANVLPERKRNKKGHILIADDEDIFLESTADLLRREGYECDCALDSETVLEKIKTTKYDLLIADINMPGNKELELIKELPKIGERMPVILATGNPMFHSEFQSIEHPVIAYMFKPLEFEKLLAQVRISIENFRGREVNLT